LKAFAVTSDRRLEFAPDTPTFAETLLPALSYSNSLELFAPKGTPGDPKGHHRQAQCGRCGKSRRSSGKVTSLRAPEALATLVKADAVKWWPIIKELGIKAE
jgi:tripartite-type tricarboxylate transporter receptor subunit TctC